MAEDSIASVSATRTGGEDPLVGRVINDRFKVLAVIARGGMGKVYRAEQAPLGRLVALKVLNPNYQGEHDPDFHKRFFLEASIASKLTHPNTVTIFDYGRTDDDIYYIAMELLEGRTLHRALRDEGPFDASRAMHIARQICRSLREAHGLNVIHRDLKPANVFLVQHGDESDFVKVLDFGLVKNLEEKGEDLTQTGLFMGSPKYMSPEQIRGLKVDARSDIYSLGVILYEMLTGKVPFDRPNSVNILMAHVQEQAPALREANPAISVSPILEAVVVKCMAKRPEERFFSMDDLLVALKQAASATGLAMSKSSAELSLSSDFGSSSGSRPIAAPDPTPSSGVMMAPDVAAAVGAQAAAIAAQANSMATAPRPAVVQSVPPPRRQTNVFVAAGIASLVAIVAAVAASWGARPSTPPAPTQDRPQSGNNDRPRPDPGPNPPPVTDVRTPTKVPERRVQVALRSTPTGAHVYIGERDYGATPTDIELMGDEAAAGREVTFLFKLRGYQNMPVLRRLASDADRIEVEARLLPNATRPPPPRRGGGGGGSGGGEAVPTKRGYKNDPY
ncbi:MAG: serine/threonine protein kinase [Deltaproteobacteria bacterium]|nr:serine/threonine protein kinase [Deltaproteobacteria bacterium]